jgi:hypothetical protein
MKKVLSKEDQQDSNPRLTKAMLNSCTRIMKSIICLGYSLREMKIVTLKQWQRPITMEIIRTKVFELTYRIMSNLETLKQNQSDYAKSDFSDFEFQNNLFTLVITIIYMECFYIKQGMTQMENPKLEEYIDVFFK